MCAIQCKTFELCWCVGTKWTIPYVPTMCWNKSWSSATSHADQLKCEYAINLVYESGLNFRYDCALLHNYLNKLKIKICQHNSKELEGWGVQSHPQTPFTEQFHTFNIVAIINRPFYTLMKTRLFTPFWKTSNNCQCFIHKKYAKCLLFLYVFSALLHVLASLFWTKRRLWWTDLMSEQSERQKHVLATSSDCQPITAQQGFLRQAAAAPVTFRTL